MLFRSDYKVKKHQPEYRRQWRKLHIGIDAETLQIHAVQLTTNNISESQVLGDLLDQIPLDEQIDMVLMTPSNAVRLLQIGKHTQ